jgi:hypothetical protein
MSKKETRRAARQAFPKAKTPAATKLGSGRVPVKGSRGGGSRGATRYAPKPPTLKRALIQGVILAVIYFLFVEFMPWGQNTTVVSNLVVSVGALVVFAGVAYFADRFKYQRYLRRQKGSSK